MSPFSYCPLVWMWHSRTSNSKINKLHEKILRLAYDDKQSTFEELLNKDKSVTIHLRNVHVFHTENTSWIYGLALELRNSI